MVSLRSLRCRWFRRHALLWAQTWPWGLRVWGFDVTWMLLFLKVRQDLDKAWLMRTIQNPWGPRSRPGYFAKFGFIWAVNQPVAFKSWGLQGTPIQYAWFSYCSLWCTFLLTLFSLWPVGGRQGERMGGVEGLLPGTLLHIIIIATFQQSEDV